MSTLTLDSVLTSIQQYLPLAAALAQAIDPKDARAIGLIAELEAIVSECVSIQHQIKSNLSPELMQQIADANVAADEALS